MNFDTTSKYTLAKSRNQNSHQNRASAPAAIWKKSTNDLLLLLCRSLQPCPSACSAHVCIRILGEESDTHLLKASKLVKNWERWTETEKGWRDGAGKNHGKSGNTCHELQCMHLAALATSAFQPHNPSALEKEMSVGPRSLKGCTTSSNSLVVISGQSSKSPAWS